MKEKEPSEELWVDAFGFDAVPNPQPDYTRYVLGTLHDAAVARSADPRTRLYLLESKDMAAVITEILSARVRELTHGEIARLEKLLVMGRLDRARAIRDTGEVAN